MTKYIKIIIALFIIMIIGSGCFKNELPLDDDDMLITTRAACYVGNFDLLGADFQTVLTRTQTPDTVNCIINAEVKYGTDLTHLYPQFSLVSDAKLEPKVAGFTDFSDLANPKQYTVVSGNRKVRKTYTVYVTVQAKP